MDEFAFILKKVLGFALKPYGLILLFLCASLFLSSLGRIILSRVSLLVAILLFLLFANPYIASNLARNIEKTTPLYQLTPDTSASYIAVLGSSQIEGDIPLSSRLSNPGTKRMLEAIRIYQAHPEPKPKLIITGHSRLHEEQTYASVASKFALAYGVEARDILTQGVEKDTVEEALTVANIAGEEHVILVSSALHLPRAMRIFTTHNISVIPAPADFLSNTLPWYAQPRIVHLQTSNLAIHEYLGQVWQILKQW